MSYPGFAVATTGRRGGGPRDLTPTSYQEAETILAGGRDKRSRTIANNTRLYMINGTIAVRLHSTDIVTFYRDGKIKLQTGGWNTLLTRGRLNRYLGYNTGTWSVGTDRGKLYLYKTTLPADFQLDPYSYRQERFAFHEGCFIYPDGTTSAKPKPRRERVARPHREGCQCAIHREGSPHRPFRGRSLNEQARTLNELQEPITTPEEFLQEAEAPEGVDGMRWAEYNRRMNAIFARKEG